MADPCTLCWTPHDDTAACPTTPRAPTNPPRQRLPRPLPRPLPLRGTHPHRRPDRHRRPGAGARGVHDMSSYRILITGSRDWTDTTAISDAMGNTERDADPDSRVVVVHGACPTGADRIAHDLAVRWGWALEPHPAAWATYGKAAGFRRNAEMVTAGADVCLAFIRNGSRGATHTATLAEKAGIPVRYWRTP